MKTSWTHETELYRYSTRDDLPDFVTLLSDPEVGRWLWFTPLPEGGVEGFFGPLLDGQAEQIAKGEVPTTAVFTVEAVEGGEFLGHGAVVGVAGSEGGFEIGFQLMPAAWGRGVGTRLGRFLCAYAIEVCGAYRIEGGCLEGNVGSAALLRKLGLKIEGTRPGYRVKGEVRHTELCFGVRVEDMEAGLYRDVAEGSGLVSD